jgi:hypothetical protein
MPLDPHASALLDTVQKAKGKVEWTEYRAGLKSVDLAVPDAGPHDHRKDDPYDAAFFEHLGHVSTLESLNVISTCQPTASSARDSPMSSAVVV